MQTIASFGIIGLILLAPACVPFNQGLEGHLSDDPEVCHDGFKYLPYTHGSDAAYTPEGRPETCEKMP